MAEPTHTCKSCQHVFTGTYCNLCGEKVLTAKERSFKTLFNQVLLTITFTDSRLIRSLWLIIKDPGSLARDFVNGKRVHHITPTALFFVLNLFYFFFPFIQLFNASLNTQLLSPFNWLYQSIIAHKIVNLNLTLDSFTLMYNLKTTGLAKLMVMAFVIISSLPLNLLYWKKNKYFADHVTYAVELASFNLFVNAILLTLFVKVLGLGGYLSEDVLTTIFISTNLYFVIRSGNTFYQEHGWRLIVKSIILILFLKIALEVYRAILFLITVAML
ncbi:MAG: DUF3667 domain-containing protein [Cyclobacteriaceae bacterium]|nr:DUF3667 domain-containing protein [Cyclobacteriaceae bacterium]